ncbi:MAG: hypothetical protein DRH34_07410 [Deltaproteobacteria bacterium]|nr:MAG: hypothetical protein DRH34_07410 [Deltaproteobacteria bacterium]
MQYPIRIFLIQSYPFYFKKTRTNLHDCVFWYRPICIDIKNGTENFPHYDDFTIRLKNYSADGHYGLNNEL